MGASLSGREREGGGGEVGGGSVVLKVASRRIRPQ